MTEDPITRFSVWWDEAHAPGLLQEPDAATLATADAHGQPSARIVLMRHFDARGFVVFTNLQSRKGQEALQGGHAALCFWWPPLGKQVRVEGKTSVVADAEADAYFSTRPRDSQLGAWASLQSTPLPAREALLSRLEEARARFSAGDVPRPGHWSGIRIAPEAIEFWQQGDFRLHHRERYTRIPDGWRKELLYP